MPFINIPSYGAASWREPVLNFSNLPTTNNEIGDVRLVTSTGQLYAWDGSSWQPLSPSSNYYHPTITLIGDSNADFWQSPPVSGVGYDPNSWLGYKPLITPWYMVENPIEYVNLKWQVTLPQSNQAYIVGPFATLNEYRDAIFPLNDGNFTIQITPFEEIDTSLDFICTGGWAFSTPMMEIFKSHVTATGTHRRYFSNSTPSNPTLNNPSSPVQQFLFAAWNVLYGDASTAFTSNPFTPQQKSAFFKRLNDEKKPCFPYSVSRQFYGDKYGYGGGTFELIKEPLVSSVGPCGARAEFSDLGTINAGYSFIVKTTPSRTSNTKFLTKGCINLFPVSTPDPDYVYKSVLLWSPTLDKVFLTLNAGGFPSQYQLDALVAPRSSWSRRYRNLPKINDGTGTTVRSLQFNISSIEVPLEVGTKIFFRIRNVVTRKSSSFLPFKLAVRRLGPCLALVQERV